MSERISLSKSRVVSFADHARRFGNVTDDLTLEQIETILVASTTGNGDSIRNILDKTITEIDNAAASVKGGTFYGCNKLTKANFPSAVSVGDDAFDGCSNLKTVNLPLVESIGNYAFRDCGKLTEIKAPLVTSLGQNVFENNILLTSVDFPLLTVAGDYALAYCALTSIKLPLLEDVPYGLFYKCRNLSSASLPKAKSIGTYAFYWCDNAIRSLNLPSAETVKKMAFVGCTYLTHVDFSNVTQMEENCFMSLSSFETLVIRTLDTMCTVASSNVLRGTAIESGMGYIYVPSSLIEQYKMDANWSVYAAQFRPLEDYTVDGTTTGSLDWDKINGTTTA